jgi:phage shock protein A
MSFLGRLKEVLVGKADRAVENAVKGDVDAVYRASVIQEETKLNEIHDLAREVKGHEFELNEKITKLQSEKTEIQTTLDLAIKENNSEIGALTVQQMDTVDAQINDLNHQLEMYKNESAEIIKALHEQEKHLSDLKAEASLAKGTIESNSIMNKIHEREKGIGLTDTDKNLEIARQEVNKAKAERFASESIEGESAENKMKAFKDKALNNSAADRFAQMAALQKQNSGDKDA